MTNPSKGLLPQLVEVLYALADSQELLTHRIRIAHLELVQRPASDESSRAVSPDPTDQGEYPHGSTDPIPGRDFVALLVSDSPESSVDSSGESAGDNSNFGVGGNRRASREPKTVALPEMPIDTATSVDEPSGPQHPMPTQPGVLQMKGSNDTTSEPDDGSYNYFDELDARLAELGDLESGSEETSS